jgi:hypothetical protein
MRRTQTALNRAGLSPGKTGNAPKNTPHVHFAIASQ